MKGIKDIYKQAYETVSERVVGPTIMNKEETPELTEQEIEKEWNEIYVIDHKKSHWTPYSYFRTGVVFGKTKSDEYWKSVLKQKDQEHEKAKLELIEFAYSERDTIVSLQKEVENLSSKLFRNDQEIT